MISINSILLAADYFYKLSDNKNIRKKIKFPDDFQFPVYLPSADQPVMSQPEIEVPLKESEIILKAPGEVANMILDYIKNTTSSSSERIAKKIKKDLILAISEYCIGKISHGAKGFMPFSKSIERDSSSQESKIKYKDAMMRKAKDIYNKYIETEVKGISSEQKSSYIDYVVKILLSDGEGIL